MIFKLNVFFCGKYAKVDGRKKGFGVNKVRSLDFKQSVATNCKDRNDDWACDVSPRLLTVIDLPTADAVYHQSCNVNFRTGRQISKPF